MRNFLFPPRIRHPFFPGLTATPARHARGPCTALAGTLEELLRAATRGVEARRAVWVLSREGEALSQRERDDLWQRFQVPVFALVLDHGGRLVAWECEAQNGLHVGSGIRPGAYEEARCACGRPGARVRVARGMPADAAK